jgi:hypothetical protein
MALDLFFYDRNPSREQNLSSQFAQKSPDKISHLYYPIPTCWALSYFFFNSAANSSNFGTVRQHVFVTQDPLTPWHLHCLRMFEANIRRPTRLLCKFMRALLCLEWN